ncbi:MAG TPA: hypothetical protein VN654_22705 [Vicinamibacterales bacterium]|jgi:hypothetical protein|nr:hypothetical protein [Vicinamibacterales bacterium]
MSPIPSAALASSDHNTVCGSRWIGQLNTHAAATINPRRVRI